MIRFLVLVLAMIAGAPAYAQVFFHDEGKTFVDSVIRTRTIGIEIEFKGLTENEVVQIIRNYFPEAQKTGALESGGLAFDTDIGPIKLVVEGQAWKFEDDPVRFAREKKNDLKQAPRELVFPPVTYDQIPRMQALISDLESKGALGTAAGLSVSLQVNLQMKELNNQGAVQDLLNLMRVYHDPAHRKQIQADLNVPNHRAEYVLDYSPGFMNRLFDTNYDPSPRQLFDDFMYRQSLEILGDKNAWSMPIAEARQRLLDIEGEKAIVHRVVKMNKIRISSLLLMAFPDDPLSRRIVSSRWARPAPIVEFREFNNDFSLLPKVRSCLGIARASEIFGAYDHDELFAELAGMSAEDIQRLRAGLKKGKNLVRYVLQDPDTSPLSTDDRRWLSKRNPGVVEVGLSAEVTGAVPLRLLDGTVVWQRRHIHRHSLMGQYNPGLENWLLQQSLENKLFEAKIFEKYAPGSLPETKALREIVKGKKTPGQIFAALTEAFQEGWVLKGAWDFGSEKLIVTDQVDLRQAMKEYENGFLFHQAKILQRYKGEDPETILYHIKKHPGYLGYKILEMLKQPELLLVQKRVPIVEEFRVEVLGGKVLGQGSTISRYAWMKRKKTKTPEWIIHQAEHFVQSVVDQLPPELQVIPYGFDAALLKNGKWVLIESNPGGNSSFLEENTKSSLALVDYLKKYPELSKGFKGLMGDSEQMTWVKKHLQEFGLQIEAHYPEIQFLERDMVDPGFPKVENEKVRKLEESKKYDRGPRRCEYLFSPQAA